MATKGKAIPEKLTADAIVEALVEVRFETTTIPEVLFGRLADHTPWKAFQQRRLAAYQIPPPMRRADPNLRFQPVFELIDPPNNRSVRIGGQVLSYHVRAPYVGWSVFSPELDGAIDVLFAKTENLTISRLGLRYLNALRPGLHGIRSIDDLDLNLVIAAEKVSAKLNINFTRSVAEDMDSTVRVATVEFIKGALPNGTSLVIDVDVTTRDSFHTKDSETVKRWIQLAHAKEKEQFFSLLKDETIDKLREK